MLEFGLLILSSVPRVYKVQGMGITLRIKATWGHPEVANSVKGVNNCICSRARLPAHGSYSQ